VAAIRPEHNLYVLKSKTPLTLAIARILDLAGAAIVNSVESCELIRDKIVTTALLARAGIPVPPSWATSEAALAKSLVMESAIWAKPRQGSKGRGIRRLDDLKDLAAYLESDEPSTDICGLPLPLLLQREVPSGGRDLKTYIVSDMVWGVAKPWPIRTVDDKYGVPADVNPDIRAAALACGEVLGLEIYGVDFLVRDGDFFVVDVNALPGFRGPPEGGRQIAAYLYDRALRGEPPRVSRLKDRSQMSWQAR
jgi:ribosomal protein S6--L-glutamate ligase